MKNSDTGLGRVGPFAATVLVLAVLMVTAAGAQDSSWQVRDIVGTASWRQVGGADWLSLPHGSNVTPPAEIETAKKSRVELLRGADRLSIGPESRLTLEQPRGALYLLVRQAAGAIHYVIHRLAGREVEVESRYLVATVKGTAFSVALEGQGDLLTVSEGVVGATSRANGESMDIRAGQSVLATAAGLALMATPDGGERSPGAPTPENRTTPQGQTGAIHGTEGDGQHNHGGEGGAAVRSEHGDYATQSGGAAKAKGPK